MWRHALSNKHHHHDDCYSSYFLCDDVDDDHLYRKFFFSYSHFSRICTCSTFSFFFFPRFRIMQKKEQLYFLSLSLFFLHTSSLRDKIPYCMFEGVENDNRQVEEVSIFVREIWNNDEILDYLFELIHDNDEHGRTKSTSKKRQFSSTISWWTK